MKGTFLTGKNIYLRPLTLKDAKGNYPNWLNDPEVCRFNSHAVFPYTKEKAVRYIRSAQSSREALVLAIVLRKNGAHIGNIALQNIDYVNRSAEFAILLGEKKYWGKGYSKEAAGLLVRHAFDQLNLNRVYCGTSATNTAMRRLALFLGMKQEGLRRKAQFKNGAYLDEAEFGVLREEFLKKFK